MRVLSIINVMPSDISSEDYQCVRSFYTDAVNSFKKRVDGRINTLVLYFSEVKPYHTTMHDVTLYEISEIMTWFTSETTTEFDQPKLASNIVLDAYRREEDTNLAVYQIVANKDSHVLNYIAADNKLKPSATKKIYFVTAEDFYALCNMNDADDDVFLSSMESNTLLVASGTMYTHGNHKFSIVKQSAMYGRR